MGCRAGACPGQAAPLWREAALQSNWDTIQYFSFNWLLRALVGML